MRRSVECRLDTRHDMRHVTCDMRHDDTTTRRHDDGCRFNQYPRCLLTAVICRLAAGLWPPIGRRRAASVRAFSTPPAACLLPPYPLPSYLSYGDLPSISAPHPPPATRHPPPPQQNRTEQTLTHCIVHCALCIVHCSLFIVHCSPSPPSAAAAAASEPGTGTCTCNLQCLFPWLLLRRTSFNFIYYLSYYFAHFLGAGPCPRRLFQP
jgi:hypothetical protein